MEGVLAAFAQFDNDVRSDRTRAGMKAALELGRWVFLAPIGYLNAPRAMGKSLMHDPERGPLVDVRCPAAAVMWLVLPISRTHVAGSPAPAHRPASRG